MTIARREFLKGSASLAALRTSVPLAGATILLSPSPAKAWVAAALAVAGTVASLVAAHNRSDGGVAALLQANHQLLLNALERLRSLQIHVGEILVKLDSLPGEIEHLLRQSETRRLQLELSGVMRGYAELLQFRDPRVPDEQWRRRETTQDAVKHLYFRLLEARQQINVLNLADPATALVAAPLGFVETSLLLLRGIPRLEVDAQIRGVYLPWLEGMTDASRPTSSAGYAAAARARLDAEWTAALESPFGQRYGLSTTSRLFACTGVNDFRDQYDEWRHEPCPGPPREVLGGKSNELPQDSNRADTASRRILDNAAGSFPTDNAPVGTIQAVDSLNADGIVINRVCRYRVRHPARVGPSERLAQDITIRDDELFVDGKGTGLLQMAIEVLAERRGQSPGFTPADSSCSVQSLDMPDGNARLSHMRALRSDADAAFRDMVSRVERINLERARVAFGAQATVAAATAREKLVSYLRLGV